MMRKKITNLLTGIWIIILSSPATAERVLPEFSGYWYTDAVAQYFDACYNPVYSYQHKSQGDPNVLAKEVLSNVPPIASCQWGDIYSDGIDTQFPTDFVGDRKDWEIITKNTQSFLQQKWKRDCKDNQGNIIDSRSALIQPSYICPKNSRIGLDFERGTFGCLTTAQPCLADIVGRDLSVPGFGLLGHVGLVQQSYTDIIIEVLNNPKGAIYLHNLSNFKHIPGSPYWGEKYGLIERKNMPIEMAHKIATTATSQMKFPFQYTLSWDYHPGSYSENSVYNQQYQEWQSVNTAQGAKFRCDSFIYYSYFTGANLSIFPEFSAPVVPHDMFGQFVSCRDAEGASCLTKNVKPLFAPKVTLSQLQLLFSSKNIDIRLADSTTQSFIKDSHIPRATKLNQLWSIALQHQDNPDLFGYLVDILSSLRPIELASDIIQNFQDQTSVENQHHLLSLLVDSLNFNAKPDSYKKNNQLVHVIKIQNFIKDVLYHSKNKEILRYAIEVYPSIVDPVAASKDINYALSRSDNLLTVEEKTLLTLRLAFETPDQQIKYLRALIDDNDSNKLFNYSLCFILSNMELQSNVVYAT